MFEAFTTFGWISSHLFRVKHFLAPPGAIKKRKRPADHCLWVYNSQNGFLGPPYVPIPDLQVAVQNSKVGHSRNTLMSAPLYIIVHYCTQYCTFGEREKGIMLKLCNVRYWPILALHGNTTNLAALRFSPTFVVFRPNTFIFADFRLLLPSHLVL